VSIESRVRNGPIILIFAALSGETAMASTGSTAPIVTNSATALAIVRIMVKISWPRRGRDTTVISVQRFRRLRFVVTNEIAN
jgi:hypothetical protein